LILKSVKEVGTRVCDVRLLWCVSLCDWWLVPE